MLIFRGASHGITATIKAESLSLKSGNCLAIPPYIDNATSYLRFFGSSLNNEFLSLHTAPSFLFENFIACQIFCLISPEKFVSLMNSLTAAIFWARTESRVSTALRKELNDPIVKV